MSSACMQRPPLCIREAARTVFDMPIDRMDRLNCLRLNIVHPGKKCAGQVYRIAPLPLRRSVDYENIHVNALNSYS